MKILATSDLHGNLPPIPECDLLIIAGDVCPMDNHGTVYQREWLDMDFRRWLLGVPARKIIGIAGNHDFVFEKHPDEIANLRLPWGYLQDSGTDFEGLSLWGLPWVPNLPSWAFHARAEALGEAYGMVPKDTDIVISHGPPRGYGDLSVMGNVHTGTRSANDTLERVKPKAFICGHIHEGFGHYRHQPQHGDVIDIYNVSFVDENYSPRYYVDREWTGQPLPPGLIPDIVEITVDAQQVPTDSERDVRDEDPDSRRPQESDQGSVTDSHGLAETVYR